MLALCGAWTKDTVLIPAAVLGGSGHVEQYQLGLGRLLQYHLIQPECSVHAAHVGLVPEEQKNHSSQE